MPKALIQQRLMTTLPRRGRRARDDTRIVLIDIALFTGVKRDTLYAVAVKRREVDDALQMQLSNFFTLLEAGLLVKSPPDGLHRIPPPAGVTPPPRATIDLSGMIPRINWSR
jgi:hypothetical protein